MCVCLFTTPAVAYRLSPLSKHTALVDITLVMTLGMFVCVYEDRHLERSESMLMKYNLLSSPSGKRCNGVCPLAGRCVL